MPAYAKSTRTLGLRPAPRALCCRATDSSEWVEPCGRTDCGLRASSDSRELTTPSRPRHAWSPTGLHAALRLAVTSAPPLVTRARGRSKGLSGVDTSDTTCRSSARSRHQVTREERRARRSYWAGGLAGRNPGVAVPAFSDTRPKRPGSPRESALEHQRLRRWGRARRGIGWWPWNARTHGSTRAARRAKRRCHSLWHEDRLTQNRIRYRTRSFRIERHEPARPSIVNVGYRRLC